MSEPAGRSADPGATGRPDMTVWDCIRALNRRSLSVKHKGRTLSEGVWLVGRAYGRFFAITDSFTTLEALGDYVAELEGAR